MNFYRNLDTGKEKSHSNTWGPSHFKNLKVSKCLPIVENITERIRCLSAKLLSYAGGLQLLKAVVFIIQTYWAQIFFLLKKILKIIEAISRTFLWTGSTEISKISLVSWDKLCMPQVAGGLNLQNVRLWTKVSILKLLWAINKKKDYLWIKWIQEYI